MVDENAASSASSPSNRLPGNETAAVAGEPSWEHRILHRRAEVEGLAGEIGQAMDGKGYSEEEVQDMEVALREAVVNALVHGNHEDPTRKVRVRYRATRDEVFIEVADQGEGFDPEKVPDPLARDNLERPSGRGLFLMRALTTSLHFNDAGNTVLLRKVRSS